MQETKPRTPADDSPAPRPPWIRAVAIVAAVALLGGALYATWQAASGTDDPEPDPIGLDESEPDFSLTDEQAIARFEELNERRVQAYETTDLSLVDRFAGPGPFKDQVVDELRRLRRDKVTAKPLFDTEYLTVTSNTPTRIALEQAVVFDLRFFDESGKDVTTKGNPERFVIDWTMAYFDQGWLLTESVATEGEPVDE
jgi:hypothetical protein